MRIMKKEIDSGCPLESVFISDLDGTLLDRRSVLSPYTKAVLTTAIEKGIRFTVASARSLFSILQLFEGVPLNQPIIANNGAVLAMPDGRVIHQTSLEAEILSALYKQIEILGATPLLTCEDGRSKLYYSADASDDILQYMAMKTASGDPRLCKTDDIFSHKVGIITVTLIETHDVVRRMEAVLKSIFGERVNIYVMELPDIDGLFTLSITPLGADKGQAVKRLRECYEKPVWITVFGDQINDFNMFEAADWRIAMDNAHEDLKAMADQMIGSHFDNAVVLYIKETCDL